jgi:hypothetical protein
MTDIFLSDGGSKYPALKFENVNDTHTGTVIEVKKLEDRDPSGTVKTWDNGDVRYVFVFTLNTADGIGNLWSRGNMVKAIREKYDTLRDWNLVRAAFGVGRVDA